MPKEQEEPISDIYKFHNWLERQEQKRLALEKKTGHSFSLYYRGISDSAYQDVPSIYRKSYIRHENELYNECLLKKPHEFLDDRTTFSKLVKMRHWGIPNRLLDITSNPLVALYFAVVGNDEKSGAINSYFVAKDAELFPENPIVSAVANLTQTAPNFTIITSTEGIFSRNHLIQKCSSPGDFERKNQKYLQRYKSSSSCAILDSLIAKDNLRSNDVQRDHLEGIWCVKPPLNNERIIRQAGAFLLFGIWERKHICPQILHFSDAQDLLNIIDYFVHPNVGVGGIDASTISWDKVKESIVNIFSSPDIDIIIQEYEKNYKKMPMDFSQEDILKTQICIQSRLAILARQKFFSPCLIGQIPKPGEIYAVRPEASANDPCVKDLPLLMGLYNSLSNGSYVIFSDSTLVQNKNTLRNILDKVSINDENLFPDLDHIATNLKKRFDSPPKI